MEISFAAQNPFSVISQLSIYAFVDFGFGVRLKNSSILMSWSLPPMLSSRSFMVSGPTFNSLSHVELIFLYGIRWWSSFILLQVTTQFTQYHLLWLFLFPLNILASCHKLLDLTCVGLFLGSLFFVFFLPFLIHVSVNKNQLLDKFYSFSIFLIN